ncbi:MAG: IgGFc-binding protein [Polyangiaceae bacterium]
MGLATCGCAAEDTRASAATGAAPGSGGSPGGTDGAGGLFTTGTGLNCSGAVSCSDDFGAVLCDGNVVQACGPNEGCANGACVDSCAAAEANKSTVGCDYYAGNPSGLETSGACFAVFVANTTAVDVAIDVERDGAALDVASFARIPSGSGLNAVYAPLDNGKLPAGEVAILFLAKFGPATLTKPDCPAGITPAVTSEAAALYGTGIARPFHITTSAPVVAYDIFPYGGGPSVNAGATLLIPAAAWDTNYIAIATYAGPQWLQIIAREDDTEVTILPKLGIEGGPGVAPAAPGVPATYSLSAGQTLQLQQDLELTGSPIQSTKPVGVVGGNETMSIPVGTYAADAAHQMIPPVRALGSEYVGVRYRNRRAGVEETPPWRIIGAVDGTTLTYEPAAPPGAPTTVASGEVLEFAAAGPFVVKSQDADHPFYMSGHMTGCMVVGGGFDQPDGCPGDPETVNVIPPAQFLKSYVFFTDPTYPETNLVFVRKRGPDGFADVSLDCAGALTGWQPADSSGNYEYTRFDLVRGNFEGQGNCDNGRHEVSSDAPFGVTVWGWGTAATGGSPDPGNPLPGFYSQWVSYAYPAGASVQSITEVEVPAVPK